MAFLERNDLRGRHYKTYQDFDNPTQFRREFTIHHQHYHDGAQWQDVDETLVDDGLDGFAKRCDKTRHAIRFGAGGQRRWYPRRDVPTEYVGITNIQYWRTAGGGQWRNLNLPAAVWRSDGAEWDTANLYARISNNWHRIKTDFILKDATAPTRLRFAIELVGLTLNTTTWELTSTTDGLVWGRLDPPGAVDANDDGLPVTANYDGQYIEWSVDVTGAVFPVAVDPTFTDGFGGDVTTYKDDNPNGQTNGTPLWQERNYGANVQIRIRASLEIKGLLEFDVSSIDASATCNSATLYMYHSQTGTNSAWTVTVYSVASGNAAWIEGTGQGTAQAAAGEPCWEALAADGSGGVTTAWAGSAGLGTSGTDYEAVAVGSFSGNRTDAAGTEYSTALTASRVQAWFGVSNTNYGLLLQNNGGGHIEYVGSSDNATTGYRPKLVVDYSAGTQYNQAAAGTVAPAGAIAKQGNKPATGSITPAGVIARLSAKSFIGALTPAGALLKQAIKSFTGALTPAGALVTSLIRLLSIGGGVAPSGTVNRRAGKVAAGSLTPVGAVIKQAAKSFVGGITPSGAIAAARTKLQVIAGSLAPAGAITRQAIKSFSGSLAPAGATIKRAAKSVAGGLTPTGVLATARTFIKAVIGSLTPSGTLTKLTSKPTTGTITPSGGIVRRVGKALAGALAAVGTLARQITGLPTPAARVYVINGEDRALAILSEDRTLVILSEDRVIAIGSEDRALAINAEDRIYAINA